MIDTAATLSRPVSRDKLVSGLRALKHAFAEEGVTHMVLFGSRARGDNRSDSDVDLMIEIAPGRKFSLVDLAGVALTVEDAFGLPASLVMRRSASPALLAAVERDGIPLF